MARKTQTKDAPVTTPIKEAEPAALPAVQDAKAIALAQADPIFSIIERLSKDPAFDVEKMERLINMHERAKAGNARAEFDQAMSLAQQEMMAVRTNAKSDKGKYANYAALDKAIRPIYTKHGFSVSFDTDPAAPELTVRLVATVAHSGGHRERRQLDVPADGKGAKGGEVMTKTHATASAITYGKRYLSSMIWNLAVDNDDDGNSAASIAERAKVFTDSAIEHLNTMKADQNDLAKWLQENQKYVNWLKKNAPDEFARYQIAYSNAAEAAGIKKEEPKRGGTKAKPASPGASPHSDPEKGDQPEAKAATGTAPSGPVVTDVVDENEAIEFDDFKTAKEFLDFSSGWIAEPGRTAAQAKQWHDKFKAKIDEYLQHEFKGTTKSWIKESMTDTFALYVKITADAQTE